VTFRYIAAYFVEGLQSLSEAPILLYEDQDGKKVHLTSHAHEGLDRIATVRSIAHVILTGMFQGKTGISNEFASQVSAAKEDRIRQYGPNAAFLVAEATHEQDAASIGQITPSDDREFYLAWPDGNFKDEIEKRHKPFLDQSLAFLAFAMPSVSGFEAVGNCIVADHSRGKPLYVLAPSFGRVRVSVPNPIPAEGPEQYATLFRHSAELEQFQTSFRLSAGSALNARDNLRSFVFAFTALESFLNKLFSEHKERLLKKEHLSPKSKAYINGIDKRRQDEGRTKDDYPVAYKFVLVASFLGLDKLDDTIKEFDATVGDRNDIAHGREFAEDALPVAKVRNWLGELVRLHVVRVEPHS
jgi:hypothetical protein